MPIRPGFRNGLAFAALLAAAGVGCKPAAPPGSEARGAVILEADMVFGSPDGGPGDRATAVLATEAEVLKSLPHCQRIVERLGLERDPKFGKGAAQLVQRALNVKRRGESLILEVSATDPDPQRAGQLCEAAMQSYLEARLERRLMGHRVRQQVLGGQLDALRSQPDAGALAALLEAELLRETTAAETRINDARVLEPCQLRGP